MRRFARENGLSLAFGLLLICALAGQAFAGWREYDQQQVADGLAQIPLSRYLTSSDFAVDVTENWQSEFLQFFLYILLTVWLVQRGSPESKQVGDEGPGSDADELLGRHAVAGTPRLARRGGAVGTLYAHSLTIVFGLFFLGSWGAQSVAGWSAYDEQRLAQLQQPVSYGRYLAEPDFWSRSLQNWQSEFLAVGAMAVLSVYLRENGSPESKPVGAPHEQTG
jgi:hypothetical protein